MDTAYWAERIRELGFTSNEAKIYVALLGEESLTAAGIVRKSGVPRPKVYEAARSLIEQGFAEEVVGSVKAFSAVAPELAFDNYKRVVENRVIKSGQTLEALAEAVTQTAPLPADAWNVRLLHGVVNVRKTVMRLEESSKEIIRLMRPPFFRGARPTRMAVRYRDDIEFYGLVDRRALSDPNKGSDVRAMGLEDSRFRLVDDLPFKGVIFDRKTFVMPLHDTTDGPTLVIPESPMLTKLSEWAVRAWQNSPALTLDTSRARTNREEK